MMYGNVFIYTCKLNQEVLNIYDNFQVINVCSHKNNVLKSES